MSINADPTRQRKVCNKMLEVTCAPEIFGLLIIPVIHMNKAITLPTAN